MQDPERYVLVYVRHVPIYAQDAKNLGILQYAKERENDQRNYITVARMDGHEAGNYVRVY